MTAAGLTPLGRHTAAGLGAAGVQITGALAVDFIALHAVIDAALIVPASLLAYAGLALALPRPRTTMEKLRDLGHGDVDAAEVAETIDTARPKVARLKALAGQLSGSRAAKVASLAETGERIVDGFSEDPSDIRRSRTFLRHYLDGTVQLVEKYVRLTEKAEHSDSAREALAKFDTGLDDMARLFQQQYEKNLADDIADFDVHLEVYQTLATQEGV